PASGPKPPPRFVARRSQAPVATAAATTSAARAPLGPRAKRARGGAGREGARMCTSLVECALAMAPELVDEDVDEPGPDEALLGDAVDAHAARRERLDDDGPHGRDADARQAPGEALLEPALARDLPQAIDLRGAREGDGVDAAVGQRSDERDDAARVAR